MDEDTEIELVQEGKNYLWTEDKDEHRRTFVFEIMGGGWDHQCKAEYLIDNMDEVSKWLKSGKVPRGNKKPELKLASLRTSDTST